MVNSNSSENKQIVREELAEFILENYTPAEIKNMKVLTLLSEQPFELKIWDKLNILRKNITTIERNPLSREKIKQNHKGIRLIENYNNINEFIADTNEIFDIINLDYTGYLNPEKTKALINISEKGMLGKKGILATWYSGRMERKDAQRMLWENYHSVLNQVDATNNFSPKYKLPNLKLINKIREKAIMTPEDIERSETITHIRALSLLFGENSTEDDFPEIIKLLNGEEKIVSVIESTQLYQAQMKLMLSYINNENAFKEKFGEQAFIHYSNMRRNALKMKPVDYEDKKWFANFMRSQNEVTRTYYEIVEEWAMRELRHNKQISKEIISSIGKHKGSLAHILLNQDAKYFILDNERFFYSGDSGTPMFVDISLVESKEFRDFYWYAEKNKRTNEMEIKFYPGTLRTFGYEQRKRFSERITALNNSTIVSMKERNVIENGQGRVRSISEEDLEELINDLTNLLNGPTKTPSVLQQTAPSSNSYSDTQKIKEMLKSGSSYEEIHSIYPALTKKQFSSYSTWNRMKSNPDAPQAGRKKKTAENIGAMANEEVQKITRDSNNIQTSLSREDALLLLNDGYTPLEIANTFGVNVWTIRGYMAGQSRKINREKEQYKRTG